MESKQEFYNTIWKYYREISQTKVPEELLDGVCNRIADYYYDHYDRFTRQYPKSVKRYSAFQVKDLEHPTTFEIIIKYFKEKVGTNYVEHVKILLNKTDSELQAFEENREDFYKMF